MSGIAIGGDAKVAPEADPAHVPVAHQSGNAFAAGHNTCILEFSSYTGHAVGFIAGDKCLPDLRCQSDVRLLTLANGAIEPAVEAAGQDLEGFTHDSHGKLGLICGKQRIDGVNVLSPLLANQAVAFANMSRSVWTWRSLRRSSISSWRSSALSMADWVGVVSWATPAIRTQLRILVA